MAGDIKEADTLTSKCRCPDVDIVTHCLNAGNLHAKESSLTVHLGDSGRRDQEDRDTDE